MNANIATTLGAIFLAIASARGLPQKQRPQVLSRAAIVDTVRAAYPDWRLVKEDGRATATGWWQFKSQEQNISIDVSAFQTVLEAATDLEQQIHRTPVGGSCLAWPGDDGVDYSECNGAVLRIRSASIVFQVSVWEEGGCDPKRLSERKAVRARGIADNLAVRLDALFHIRVPPNPSLQRTRYARR